MRIIRIISIISLIILFAGCRYKAEETTIKDDSQLTIYVAAGFRPALEVIEEEFCKNNQFALQKNYASSGTLARQIANGANCDIFISANKQWIDYLLEKGIVESSSVRIIAGNSLVAIAPLNSEIKTFSFNSDFDISSQEIDKIAVGNPGYVPVGKYSKMVLDSLDWYSGLSDNLIMCKDVSSVRHYIELGECDWGIVYYTEAIQSKKIKIVAEIPQNLYGPIYFYMVRIKSGNKESYRKFSDFIASDKGQEILCKNGFITKL